MKEHDNEHMEMIEDCMARESMLSDWESNFIDDISHRIGEHKPLTPKQAEKLESIWEKVTANG